MTGLILTWTILGLFPALDDQAAASSSELKREEPSITLHDLTPRRQFKVAPYARAAKLLQEMGKEKACKQLTKLAQDDDEDGEVVILCRLLFSKKGNNELPRFPFGCPSYMGATTDVDWPNSPVELVDNVPFFIVSSYCGSGPPPHAFSLLYLNYYIENCEWSKTRYGRADEKTIDRAFKKLLASKKWRRPLTDDERERLIYQTK
jgi:hypothetical protein